MPAWAQSFLRDDGGAITIDWIVLTAGIVTLALGVTTLVVGSPGEPSGMVARTVVEQPLGI